jgi:uncharacterized delta-60 repeat protein
VLSNWPLVSTFGGNNDGHLTISGFEGEFRAVARQSAHGNEYFVAVGWVKCVSGGQAPNCDSDDDGNANWAVARFNAATGALDTQYFANGHGINTREDWDDDKIFETGSVPYNLERANGVVIDADNKIMVVGYSYSDNTTSTGAVKSFVFMRFTEDGVIDSSFGRNNSGKQFAGFYDGPGGDDCGFWRENEAWDVITDPPTGSNQKYVAVGWSKRAYAPPAAEGFPHFAIARLTNNGQLDGDFGNNPCTKSLGDPVTVKGMRVINYASAGNDDSKAYALARDGDGNYILVGTNIANGATTGDFLAMKMCSNGKLVGETGCSGTFGANGKKLVDISGAASDDKAEDVVLQPATNPTYIVMAGTTNDGDYPNNFSLVRLDLSDGALSSGFGSSGKLRYDFDAAQGSDTGTSVILHDSNKILIGGATIPTSGAHQFAGTRFPDNGAGQAPDCGTPSNCNFKSAFDGNAGSHDMARASNGSTVVVGFRYQSTVSRLAAILLCPSPTGICLSAGPSGGNGRASSFFIGPSGRKTDFGSLVADGNLGRLTITAPLPIRLEADSPERLESLNAIDWYRNSAVLTANGYCGLAWEKLDLGLLDATGANPLSTTDRD